MKLSIIVPAHNEEKRIGKMLSTYHQFFSEVRAQNDLDFEFVVVLNGCKDGTIDVVEDLRKSCGDIIILDLPEGGKGLAIKAGFADALTRPNDLIGFVDADMATLPQHFYDLVLQLVNQDNFPLETLRTLPPMPFELRRTGRANGYDGVIASRYMFGAMVTPPRPKMKRWGSKLIYESWVRLLFGLNYHDYQCGAKLFSRAVIEKVTPELTVRQWAFDVELLYLCKRDGFKIKEIPTVWTDQQGSTLTPIRSGLRMLASLFKLRLRVR
jgi:glycosyltransferase involved in cell wall biosynthesis